MPASTLRTACQDGVALGQKIGRRAAQMYLLPTVLAATSLGVRP
jgi:hypothetical protein